MGKREALGELRIAIYNQKNIRIKKLSRILQELNFSFTDGEVKSVDEGEVEYLKRQLKKQAKQIKKMKKKLVKQEAVDYPIACIGFIGSDIVED